MVKKSNNIKKSKGRTLNKSYNPEDHIRYIKSLKEDIDDETSSEEEIDLKLFNVNFDRMSDVLDTLNKMNTHILYDCVIGCSNELYKWLLSK